MPPPDLRPADRHSRAQTWLDRWRLEAAGEVGEQFGEGDGRVVLIQRAEDLHANRKAAWGAAHRRGHGGQEVVPVPVEVEVAVPA
jgi:hypothetical protein